MIIHQNIMGQGSCLHDIEVNETYSFLVGFRIPCRLLAHHVDLLLYFKRLGWMLKDSREAGVRVQGLGLGGERWPFSWEILEISDLNGSWRIDEIGTLTVVDIEFGFYLSTVFFLVVLYNLPLENNQICMHDRKLGKRNTKNQDKIAQRQTKSSLMEDGSDHS